MRAVRRVAAVGLSSILVGCYALVPTGGTVPKPGTVMGFDLNDVGRYAVGGTIGPEIGQIEGRLIQKDSTEYVVGVTGLHLLRGGEQVWHGEVIHLKTAWISSTYERKFSAARSIALGTAGIGAIAAIAAQSLGGLGSIERPGPSPGDTAQTLRRPRR